MNATENLGEILSQMQTPVFRDANCDTHGAFSSRRVFGDVWAKCPVCIAEAEIEAKARKEAEEQDRARRQWEAKIGTAGIPDRFQDRSLGAYVASTEGQRRALEFATAYADKFDDALGTGRSALFLGKPGTGKTHLAIGIGLRIMRRDNRKVLFCTVMRALRRVKDTWSRGSETSESQAIDAMVFPDLLILDEVGVQFGSETEKLILFDILNERYAQRKPSLLLSNLSVEEVKGYLGERVFDRIREDKGEVIVFDWESHRGKQ